MQPSTAATPVAHPLRRYSLLNAADEVRKLAQEQTPLLGNVCLRGQTTVWYAKPNTGKTLICMHELPAAVIEGRLAGEDTYYIAADDNPAGLFEKIELLQPYGIHVLAPGFQDFDARNLASLLLDMAHEDKAKNSFVIMDTLKKAVSLMDKRLSSNFAEFARRFVMRGGTFLGLAHTNKKTNKDGTPIFAGTSDILDDFDCGYTIMEVGGRAAGSERVVQFNCIKSRGNAAQQVSYAYSVEPSLPYAARVESVHLVDSSELAAVSAQAQAEKDKYLIEVIEACMAESPKGKMELTKEVAVQTRVGRNTIAQIIDRYSGDDPEVHRWTFDTYGHGKRGYRLIGQQEDTEPSLDNIF
jgi:hypothetical protein